MFCFSTFGLSVFFWTACLFCCLRWHDCLIVFVFCLFVFVGDGVLVAFVSIVVGVLLLFLFCLFGFFFGGGCGGGFLFFRFMIVSLFALVAVHFVNL